MPSQQGCGEPPGIVRDGFLAGLRMPVNSCLADPLRLANGTA